MGKITRRNLSSLTIAGANRDPKEFPEPERIDIARKPNRHVAFAMKHHVWLGASLVRIEGQIAIGKLVRRFPKIMSSGPAISMGLARFRGFNSMPVSIYKFFVPLIKSPKFVCVEKII